MTKRTYAPWVQPIAGQLRESRGEIARTARQLLPEHWSMPSPLEGWTYKDLLAHLATGDWMCQYVLGAVTSNERLDLSKVGLDYVNARNERLLVERKDRAPDELIIEVEAESEETQELLARLTAEDEGRKQEGAPVSLGQYLNGYPGHDRTHLEQLRTALDNVML